MAALKVKRKLRALMMNAAAAGTRKPRSESDSTRLTDDELLDFGRQTPVYQSRSATDLLTTTSHAHAINYSRSATDFSELTTTRADTPRPRHSQAKPSEMQGVAKRQQAATRQNRAKFWTVKSKKSEPQGEDYGERLGTTATDDGLTASKSCSELSERKKHLHAHAPRGMSKQTNRRIPVFQTTLSNERALMALAHTVCKREPAGFDKTVAVLEIASDVAEIDRLMTHSGWQKQTFLTAPNICFVHMAMSHALCVIAENERQTHRQSRAGMSATPTWTPSMHLSLEGRQNILRAVLYISFCYIGAETGYPAWPFKPVLWEMSEFHLFCFWLSSAISKPMLEYNRSSEWQKAYSEDLERVLKTSEEEKMVIELDLDDRVESPKFDKRRRSTASATTLVQNTLDAILNPDEISESSSYNSWNNGEHNHR